MAARRIGVLSFILLLAVPAAGIAQSQPTSLTVTPGTIYLPPASPSCFTLTVGGGANMYVDFEYYYQGNGPNYVTGYLMDSNGQSQICLNASSLTGLYLYTGIRNAALYWTNFVPVHASLSISTTGAPVISSLASGCDNWDCIWIAGSQFRDNSYVYVYSADWSTYQIFWGPAWGQSPALGVGFDGTLITFQITNPAVRSSFGSAGVYVLVVNADSSTSAWRWTHSPPPIINSGDAGCDDSYCIWLSGIFPLNATVDFRPHGQSNVLNNAYNGIGVTPSLITLGLNAGMHYTYDTVGLDAWAVNALFPNWSGGFYLPPKDRSIVGHVDWMAPGVPNHLEGWACAKTYASSIDVRVYVGGPPGSGTLVLTGTANQSSEAGMNGACNGTGTHYRFSLPIPNTVKEQYSGQAIYVYGISAAGFADTLIPGSGSVTVPAMDHSITGLVTGVTVQNGQYYLQGWACAKGYTGNVDIQLYVGGPAGAGGTFLVNTTANQPSEAGIAAACQSTGVAYRYSTVLSLALRQQYGGQPLYVYGISPYGLGNLLLGNSGLVNMPSVAATSLKEYIYLKDRALAVDTTNLP